MKKIFTALYLVFLSWLILFKLSTNIPDFIASQSRSLNLIPFASSGGGVEVLLNFMVFIPMAMLVASSSQKWQPYQQFIFLAMLSLVYESLQYLFAIGATDVTDLLTNSMGSLFGLLLYVGLSKSTKDKTATGIAIFLSLAVMIVALLISHTGIFGIRIRF